MPKPSPTPSATEFVPPLAPAVTAEVALTLAVLLTAVERAAMLAPGRLEGPMRAVEEGMTGVGV